MTLGDTRIALGTLGTTLDATRMALHGPGCTGDKHGCPRMALDALRMALGAIRMVLGAPRGCSENSPGCHQVDTGCSGHNPGCSGDDTGCPSMTPGALGQPWESPGDPWTQSLERRTRQGVQEASKAAACHHPGLGAARGGRQGLGAGQGLWVGVKPYTGCLLSPSAAWGWFCRPTAPTTSRPTSVTRSCK